MSNDTPTKRTPRPGTLTQKLNTGTDPNLWNAAKEAERLVAIDDHISAIAQELRTPLTVVQLETSSLEQRLATTESGSIRRALDKIARYTAVMERVVAELADLSAIEGGRLQLCREATDVVTLVSETININVAVDDRIRVRLDLREVALVSIDIPRIQRVIANLLHNAFRASPPSAQVVVRVDVHHERVAISVVDVGPGLTADQKIRVFEKDRKALSTDKHEAAYVALYVSRRIVEAHGGVLGVDTVPGKGSRFWLDLPKAHSMRDTLGGGSGQSGTSNAR